MKTFLLSVALFGFVAVAPAFAGGSLDVLGEQTYQAGLAAQANGGSGSLTGSSTTDATNANGQQSDTDGSASSRAVLWQVILVVIIVGAALGLLIWAYRRNKVV